MDGVEQGEATQHGGRRPSFCWACGAAIGPALGPPCYVCGSERDLPRWEPDSLVGCNIEFRYKLSHRFGLVLAEDGDNVTVEHQQGGLLVPKARIKDVVPDPRPSPGYRLYCARNTHLPGSASLAERRAFAGCAVAAGDFSALEASGLGSREQAWLRMWTHYGHGALDAALAEAVRIEPALYVDKLGVFVATIDRWVIDPEIRSLVFGFGALFPDDPLAQVLFAIVADPMPDATRHLAAVKSAGVTGVDAGPRVHELVERLENGQVVAAASGSRFVSDTALRTLALKLAQPGAGIPRLVGLDMSVVDDAIDGGVLTAEHLDSVTTGLDAGACQYLSARLTPGDLSEDQLIAIGHDEELQRRALIGERSASDVAGGRGTFDLLERLRRGDPRVVGDLVPTLSPQHAAVAIAVGTSLHTGQVDPVAVADPSTWDVLAPVLARAASDRPDQLTPEVRDAAGWALLDLAKRELFRWKWSSAVNAAVICMNVVDDEPRSDEATAIKAAAALMDGRRDLAVQYLAAAADGDASDSLLVNLALLSADTEPRRAAGALLRLASQTDDETLRVRAAVRAARLYLSADPDWQPPTTHLKLLREACLVDVDLAEHLEIMKVVAFFDPGWISNASNTARSVHASTLAHKLVIARATGVDAVLDELERFNRDPSASGSVARETAQLVEQVVVDMSEAEEPVLDAAMLGLGLFDRKLPVDEHIAVAVRTRCVREVCWFIAASEESLWPPESLHQHLNEADRSIRHLETDLQHEAREQVAEARVTLGQTWCGCWSLAHDLIVETFNAWVEMYNEQLAEASTYVEEESANQFWRNAIESLRVDLQALINSTWSHSAQIPRRGGVRETYDALVQSMHELDARLGEEVEWDE